MEKVLEAGEEFGEMRDIIARYDTLTATHEVRNYHDESAGKQGENKTTTHKSCAATNDN